MSACVLAFAVCVCLCTKTLHLFQAILTSSKALCVCMHACICFVCACVKGSSSWNYICFEPLMSSCVCLHVRKGLCTTTLHLFRAILISSKVVCEREREMNLQHTTHICISKMYFIFMLKWVQITRYWKPLRILHHFKMTYTCTMTQHMYNEDKIMIVHVHLKKRDQKQNKIVGKAVCWSCWMKWKTVHLQIIPQNKHTNHQSHRYYTQATTLKCAKAKPCTYQNIHD